MKTNLKMAPYNTTLMGTIHGVLESYGRNVSPGVLFGASGHAFLINIHEQICPSGPYCWKPDGFNRLIENLGVRMKHVGFYMKSAGTEERAAVERTIREAIDAGVPCSLCNLEHQLITGYDESGFLTPGPWEWMPEFPPARLTYGDWTEFGPEFHASFFTFERTEPVPLKGAVASSLEYAAALHRTPGVYAFPKYGIGPDAYRNWKLAVPEHGGSHGNWWNATVWSECRSMAAEYFAEIARSFPAVEKAALALRGTYREIADRIGKAADKALPAPAKVGLIDEAARLEAQAMEEVEALRARL